MNDNALESNSPQSLSCQEERVRRVAVIEFSEVLSQFLDCPDEVTLLWDNGRGPATTRSFTWKFESRHQIIRKRAKWWVRFNHWLGQGE